MLSSPRGPLIACIPGYTLVYLAGEIYLLLLLYLFKVYGSLIVLLTPDFNILIPSKTGFYPGK